MAIGCFAKGQAHSYRTAGNMYFTRTRTQTIRFDAFVSEVYLPHVKTRKRSWKVDESIARRHLSHTFGDKRLIDIKRLRIEYWLQALLNTGLSPGTCNRILAVMKSICTLALIRGAWPDKKSPCSEVPFFKTQAYRERYLSHEEATRLMDILKKSVRAEALALRLLILTGARKNEILRARWEDLCVEQRRLTVPVSKSGGPRHIHLSDAAIDVITSIRRKGKSPWIFPGYAKNKPLSDIYHFWNRLRNQLDLADVRVHDLRHTFASFLVNSGHSLYVTQALLGHKDPKTTMRYAHLQQGSLMAATQSVSDYLTRYDQKNKDVPPLARIRPYMKRKRTKKQFC